MKKATAMLCAVLSALLMMGTALAAPEAVTFADPVVEAVIREALGRPEGSLTAADLLAVEVFEYGEQGSDEPKIALLDDLAMCKNLKELSLTEQPVLTLEPLRGLEALASVALYGVPVEDIAPLAGMESLRAFAALSTPIKDYAPVLALAGLETFVSTAGNAVDIAPLADTDALRVFYLRGVTEPMDYAPLTGHADLRRVALSQLEAGALPALAAHWPKLDTLEISHSITTADDLAALEVTRLSGLKLHNCHGLGDMAALAGFEGLQNLALTECGTLDLAPLAGLDHLVRLDVRGSQAAELAPLAGCMGLKTLVVSDGFCGMTLAEMAEALPGVEVTDGTR